MLRFFISVVLYSLPGTFPPIPKKNVKMQFESSVDYFPMQNVKLNHYIAVFERVVLLCKICEQQTSNRIESLAIESGCIRE